VLDYGALDAHAVDAKKIPPSAPVPVFDIPSAEPTRRQLDAVTPPPPKPSAGPLPEATSSKATSTLTSSYRSIQRVYFDDLDALNILHNVRFLLFMERARGELFNALGFRWEDDLTKNPDKYHVVAEHTIDYRIPVRGEGELLVEIAPVKLGKSSLTLKAWVKSKDGEIVYSTALTRLVRLDPKTERSTSWSDRFRAAVAPLVLTE
jgi:acyl-CoA thioester hydrolase